MLWRSYHSQVGGWVNSEQSQHCGCSSFITNLVSPSLFLLSPPLSPSPRFFSFPPSTSEWLQQLYTFSYTPHVPLPECRWKFASVQELFARWQCKKERWRISNVNTNFEVGKGLTNTQTPSSFFSRHENLDLLVCS